MSQTAEVLMNVPVGDRSEVALMAALEHVICGFMNSYPSLVDNASVARAVNWLQAKYGSQTVTNAQIARALERLAKPEWVGGPL